MFCKNCGKEIKAGAKFCLECGTPVVIADATPNTNQIKVDKADEAIKEAEAKRAAEALKKAEQEAALKRAEEAKEQKRIEKAEKAALKDKKKAEKAEKEASKAQAIAEKAQKRAEKTKKKAIKSENVSNKLQGIEEEEIPDKKAFKVNIFHRLLILILICVILCGIAGSVWYYDGIQVLREIFLI